MAGRVLVRATTLGARYSAAAVLPRRAAAASTGDGSHAPYGGHHDDHGEHHDHNYQAPGDVRRARARARPAARPRRGSWPLAGPAAAQSLPFQTKNRRRTAITIWGVALTALALPIIGVEFQKWKKRRG